MNCISTLIKIIALSGAVSKMPNKALACKLYEIAEELPDEKALHLIEAAERLVGIELTETEQLREN